MKIKILYEDSNILAIDKSSGILSCGDERTDEESIFSLLQKKYPKIELVHRLDKETSGVLLFAKNKKAQEFLKKQFQNREIKKTYIAIVNGSVKNDHGIINKPIGRSPSDFRRHLAGRGARGTMREAITEYKVLKRFKASCAQNFSPRGTHLVLEEGRSGKNSEHIEPFTYLEIKPKTGRTHQIRVHMKFLNHPVVCDSLYNPNGIYPKEISRMTLHSKSIEFKNLKGETIKVESPIPAQFKKVVK